MNACCCSRIIFWASRSMFCICSFASKVTLRARSSASDVEVSNRKCCVLLCLTGSVGGVESLAGLCRCLAGVVARLPLLSPCFREECCRALLVERLVEWSLGGREGFLASRPPARAPASPELRDDTAVSLGLLPGGGYRIEDCSAGSVSTTFQDTVDAPPLEVLLLCAVAVGNDRFQPGS